MSAMNIEVVRAFQPGPAVDLTRRFRRDADPAEVDAWLAAVSPLLTDDFVCEFTTISQVRRQGAEGLRAIWLEWLAPWDSYRVGDRKLTAVDDARVMVIVRDFGRRRGSAGEIELHGAAIYTVRGDKISKAEYFAKQADAYAAAGIEPPG